MTMNLLIIGFLAASQATSISMQRSSAVPVPTAVATMPDEPDAQKQFCALVGDYMKEQTAYTRETNPIRKASMRQPNPQATEPQIKSIFGPPSSTLAARGVSVLTTPRGLLPQLAKS